MKYLAIWIPMAMMALLLAACANDTQQVAKPGEAGAAPSSQAWSGPPTAAQGGGGATGTGPAAAALTEPAGTPAPLVSAAQLRAPVKNGHTLQPVYFAFDGATLSAQARHVLTRHSAWLRDHPGVVVRVGGHADERGTSAYNLGLGQHRAESVLAFLRASGVSAAAMRPVSFGEEIPARAGHDEAAWRMNRRAEFTLLSDTVARTD